MIRAALIGALLEQARLCLEKDWHEAAPLVQEALRLEPGFPQALSLQLLINDSRRAEEVETWVARARQGQREGKIKEALAAVDEGLAAYPQKFRLLQLKSTLAKSLPDSDRPSPAVPPATSRTASFAMETMPLGGPTLLEGPAGSAADNALPANDLPPVPTNYSTVAAAGDLQTMELPGRSGVTPVSFPSNDGASHQAIGKASPDLGTRRVTAPRENPLHQFHPCLGRLLLFPARP